MSHKHEQSCPCGASIRTDEYSMMLSFKQEHTPEHALAAVAIKRGHYVSTEPQKTGGLGGPTGDGTIGYKEGKSGWL